MVAELSVQATQNPNIKAYHTKFELSDGPEEGSRGSAENLGEFGRLVLRTRGVVQVHLHSYTMLVTKAALFSWDEVSPPVENILREFMRSQHQLEDATNAIAMGRTPGTKVSERRVSGEVN